MTVWQEELSGTIGLRLVGVRGRLDQGLNPKLEATLNQLLNEGCRHLIVDLAEVTYINSGGLRILVSIWRKIRQQDGSMVLCGLNSRLQEVFTMVGFDKVFQIFPTRTDAHQAMEKVIP